MGKKLTTADFIEKAKEVHGDTYDYSKVNYVSSQKKVEIICKTHGVFDQIPSSHTNGNGCYACNRGFSKEYVYDLVNLLSEEDLMTMSPLELVTIIGQGKLPKKFDSLTGTLPNSKERLKKLKDLKKECEKDKEESFDDTSDDTYEEDEKRDSIEGGSSKEENEIIKDIENSNSSNKEKEEDEEKLPSLKIIKGLKTLDRKLYANMDEEVVDALIQYKVMSFWTKVLTDESHVDTLKKETGGEYFQKIKDIFLKEYDEVTKIEPEAGYSFPYQPNLMQKLTVHRIQEKRFYNNFSGTGAGKTLSFILASRKVNAKLTVVVAVNSTVKQMKKSILEVYPDSRVFDSYEKGTVFNRNYHNYLILNYEKFQKDNSESLFQDLNKNNCVDFFVFDEIHNAKQRSKEESKRRKVLLRLRKRSEKNNSNICVLGMSATPVINNLKEAVSLLELTMGKDYSDLSVKKGVSNAIEIHKHLMLNGVRFLPKYDVSIKELSGSNMSNLNIDGSDLYDQLMSFENGDYVSLEKLLLEKKLDCIKGYLKKGTIIYSQYVTGIIPKVAKWVELNGFTVGTYSGEESADQREEYKNKFISGEIDILVGSKPIGTGVDGLQGVCDRMIALVLPWTDADYKQLKGRIHRQGSKFDNVEIIIPQVKIHLGGDDFWSWDMERYNLLKSKESLADIAVDGILPKKVRNNHSTLLKKSIKHLRKWKDRINDGKVVHYDRPEIYINLYPDVEDEEDRKQRAESELSEFNQKGKTTRSENMHRKFSENPTSWHRYHALRKSRMEEWSEIPYEYIATKITSKDDVIADFGCGENLFRKCDSVKDNEVHSFDHVAIDDSVVACDMKNTGLDDNSVDVAVFSLALWGPNYLDYLEEARRLLTKRGAVYIAEPLSTYDDEKIANLVSHIKGIGFGLLGSVERRSKFVYLTFIKE